MSAVQGTDVVVAYKKQSGLGSPASGSGGTGIEVRPSQGLQQQVQTIQSQIMRRNLMRQRPRQGSKTVTAQYETELQVGNGDGIFAGVLGGTTNSATLTEASGSLGSVTITGTGTTITAGGGSWITQGVRRGMMGKFADLSVAGNNGVWFPITDVSASVITVPSGYLADNSIDSAFTLVLAKYFSTPTPRPVEYYTFEEYLGSGVDFSKVGVDMKFNSLNFSAQPNQMVTFGFGLTGLNISAPTGVSAPSLDSPTFNAQASPSSLVLLDGAIYADGTPLVSLTGFTAGLQAQASVQPLLTTRIGSDVVLGMFDFAGQFTGQVIDDSFFQGALAESQISLFIRMSENESDPSDFVSIYIGDASYGGSWSAPIADGQLIQTVPIYAGSDGAGTGSVDTTMLISTSAA